MRKRVTYLFVLILALVISGVGSKSLAQSSLGVVWNLPESPTAIEQDLSQFRDLGISHVEIKHPVTSDLLVVLQRNDLTAYVNASLPYITNSELAEINSSLLEYYQSVVSNYQDHSSVQWIGLLSDSQVYDDAFTSRFQSVLGSLTQNDSLSFYYIQGKERFSFENTAFPFGITFTDSVYTESDLNSFDAHLSETAANGSDQILFVDSRWLLQALENYPALEQSIINYHENGEWLFPNPEINASTGVSFHWIVMVLLFLWGLLAIQFRYLPYVRPMILRYFFGHRFYVDDIVQYRERNAVAGISLIVSHALFGGIVLYITSKALLSTNGLQALFHHLPFLSIFGESYYSLFLIGSLCVLVIECIAILWLHLPAKNLPHISQTINLYSGVFFLDYILLTLMVTLFVQEARFVNLLLTLSVIYTAIWYASFSITAVNASKTMGGRRLIYLILTIGLHTLVSAFLLFLMLSTDSLMEVLNLSISV